MQDQKTITRFNKPRLETRINQTILDPENYCRLRFSPMLATGVILDILRSHFGNPNSITNPELNQYVWSPVRDETNIVIEPENYETLGLVGMLPGILVKREQFQLSRMAIGDYFGSSPQADYYGQHITGKHILSCIASSYAQAEVIAYPQFIPTAFSIP
jgi:hypothetical protein